MKILISIFALAAMTMAVETDNQKLLRENIDLFTSRMFTMIQLASEIGLEILTNGTKAAHKEVARVNPGSSVVLSAFSVMIPLAQLGLASVGESHDELLKVMGFPNDNVTKDVFTELNRDLRTVKGVELKMANKVYIPTVAELNEQYATVSKDVFNSEVQNVDFSQNKATAETINTWVEDQTNHRIKDLVDPNTLDASTRAVLVNAIYFKGSWKEKFDKASTTDRDFHVTKTKTIKVPTMYKKGNFRYGESVELNAKLLEMYYEGEQSSLFMILPNEIDGINGLIEKLQDRTVFPKAEQRMYTTEVDVYLPKFKIETTTNLKEVLQQLGIKQLFEPGKAKLNNLLKGESDLYVSDAIQKAFMEINEEGAEAAAANAFILALSPMPIQKIEFKADKPFYFELRHKTMLLFNGLLIQPS